MKRDVRTPARLVLFFSICFVIVLLAAVILRFLELRIDELRSIPGPPETRLPEFISALQWALAPALYISILLGLSYTSRRNIAVSLSVFILLAVSLAMALGFSLGIDRLRQLPQKPVPAAMKVPGEKGLILSQAGAAVILLRGPGEIQGPRVVSLPGQPLIYQGAPPGPANAILPLPPLPFRDETTPFLTSLFIDFTLTARQFENRLTEGFLSLGSYAAALILFLVSLRFLMDIGSWPLASFCLGAVVFRGILALETFLNAQEIQVLLISFTGERIPPFLISPLVFCFLGLLILLYTALVYAVKGRRRERD